jgi:hypothetical protein
LQREDHAGRALSSLSWLFGGSSKKKEIPKYTTVADPLKEASITEKENKSVRADISFFLTRNLLIHLPLHHQKN